MSKNKQRTGMIDIIRGHTAQGEAISSNRFHKEKRAAYAS
ncbi:UNVERIFIED_CONTAM: hypothetical protein BJ099_108118 [Lysinibacillus xylanilyticus]